MLVPDLMINNIVGGLLVILGMLCLIFSLGKNPGWPWTWMILNMLGCFLIFGGIVLVIGEGFT